MSNRNLVTNPQTCESVAYVPMKVSTPIDLKPFVRELPIRACVCEEPELTLTPCGTFIVTQRICFEIPIEIGVESKIGNPFVNPKHKPYKEKYYHWSTPNVTI
ncbi:hypothetical protein E9840_11485 [Tissierella creatinini]|nr:hypothetical protein E9840_11485 [Tissierella creatinini]TJX61948.1 hypothetical protein E8P77_17595 [Soehngenia saccharolytica]